jgi:GTP-binding protein
MGPEHGLTRLIFEIPTRGLLGYRGQFIMDTRGEGIMAARVIGFKPHVGNIEKRELGAMVSMIAGKALGYALFSLQERGTLYINPNVDVYEGQIIGNVSKGNDLMVNPTKGKKLSNVRASGTDDAITLTPPFDVSLERGLEILAEDEYLEITPMNIRLRKKVLREGERKR